MLNAQMIITSMSSETMMMRWLKRTRRLYLCKPLATRFFLTVRMKYQLRQASTRR